ncbi:hypothetical protein HMPREF0444_0810 [Granulicatella adiacens ATCC 49175]|uniref:Uncharacterized protein n=1 Tax=Granulicatella adiacens ATCC 49175 TaxID=638301 RepID=C8NFW5_9LACT|nr:hypothetical protein HMPREF0444_0810 [Granulicatella adiacens ATCC 49175]
MVKPSIFNLKTAYGGGDSTYEGYFASNAETCSAESVNVNEFIVILLVLFKNTMRTFIRLLLQKEDYSCFFAQEMVK